MAEDQIDLFILPRPDWYDKEGRIFKDALIENFNALEEKLIEISKLDAFEVRMPDINNIDYPDVTLESQDNKIINLRSFLTMTGLIGYPIECVFSNTSATKVAYWNPAFEYKIIENKETNASASKPYIYLNYKSNTVTSSASSDTPSGCVLIACYDGGIVKCVNSKDHIGINALYYLANMSNNMYNYTFDSGTRDSYNGENGIAKNGRVIGGADTNKKTRTTNHVTFRDIGRTSS